MYFKNILVIEEQKESVVSLSDIKGQKIQKKKLFHLAYLNKECYQSRLNKRKNICPPSK